MATWKQKHRQEYRDRGRYAAVNPCYACGKSAGVDYFSHHLTDTEGWGDEALVLCAKCSDKTKDMVKVEEFLDYKKKFGDAAERAWDKVSQGRIKKASPLNAEKNTFNCETERKNMWIAMEREYPECMEREEE